MKHGARWALSAAAVCAAAATGCGGEERLDPVAGGGGAGGAGGGAGIAWEACPLITGGSGSDAECADVEVPADWRDPGGQTITVFVKRVLGTAPGRRQLWLLSGGPGGSGAMYDTPAQELAASDPTLDIYIPDHRGVGRSSRLGCPEESPADHSIQEGDWPACIDALERRWGPLLGAFNTTNAAKDLGALIDRTRAPGQDVHVLGISYGTLWAQRYLQIFPDQPTAVTLDSMCQAGLCSFFTFDAWHDQVGRKLLDACAADPFCAGKMGPDPVATVGDAFAGIDAGACAPLAALGVDRPLARLLFALLVESFELRVLVPALAYRYQRCDPGDVAAFQSFFSVLFAPPGDPDPAALLDSTPLGMNIGLSEMVEADPPSLADLQAFEDGAYFATGNGTSARALYDLWPRYPRDEYVGKYAPTGVPMLMLNGTLDPQTPIEFALEITPNYTQPHQTFVPIDRAVHATVVGSPTSAPPHTPCGLTMWLGFLGDFTAPIDASCVAGVAPIGFEGDPALAQALLGTADLWENGAPLLGAEPGPELRRAVEELRRAWRRSRRHLL